ncbi:MAG: hypothetical protein Q7K54_06675 [Candidatus Parcubacteria bacterium]|nr:hypothetical protein [Candidatus Parcubacteria bacterium]
MDIFAHTLWANAVAREANIVAKEKQKKFHVRVAWASFWGVFPDLFAFLIPFTLQFYQVIFSEESFFAMRDHHGLVGGFDIAHILYQYSHSLIIWAIVFLLVWFFYKRPRYELLGWLLHILIDIPSHTLAFFPTPFLFPISDYKFPYGVQWGSYWFMVINYSLLFLVWGRFLVKDYLAKRAYK